MNENEEIIKRKKIVFLSSSFVNLGKLFAENNPEFDVFLILDRKFPFDIQTHENFYTYIYDKNKIFEKNKDKYFDELAVFIDELNPDFIICNNYHKLLIQSFIDFMNFRDKNRIILNLHHGDLRILEENNDMKFKGLNADVKQFLDEAMIITTIHKIEDNKMDEGEILAFSHETTLKELKRKGFVNKKEEILNYRVRNVILSFHERTKVLGLLKRIIEKI